MIESGTMAKRDKVLPRQHVTRRRLARWQQERRKRRFYVSAGIAIIAVVIGIIIYGVYDINISMANKWVTTVGDTRFVGNDYAHALHLCQLGFHFAGSDDTREAPIQLLERDELVKQDSATLHITVNESEIDYSIRNLIQGNQSMTDEEFQQAYQESLEGMRLTEEQFTVIIRNSLLQQKFHEHLLADVPEVGENTIHIYIESLVANNQSELTEIQALLGEGKVLADLMGNYIYNDIGWTPKGVLILEMERVAFNLSVGDISQPMQFGNAYIFIEVSGKEERPLQQEMRNNIEYNALQRWILEETDKKVQRNPDLDLDKMYDWALAKVEG